MGKEEADLLQELRRIIRKLRSGEGCAWDREQTKEDAGRYLIEEAYEVIDAIDGGLSAALREELGDLLFQILFLTQIAEEEGEFGLSGVIEGIMEKMIRRHPHVFGEAKADSVDEVKARWQDIKSRVEGKTQEGLLAGVPRSLPALRRAQLITERASSVGFDWDNAGDILKKLVEELHEFEAALRDGARKKIAGEIGDMLFCLVNLSRFIRVDAEAALRATVEKFVRRFSYIERSLLARGKTPAEVSLADMDSLWDESKIAQGD